MSAGEWVGGFLGLVGRKLALKKILGTALILAGIVVWVYAGIWWALVGGFVDVIEQARAPIMDTTVVGISILRIMFAGVIGFLSSLFLVLPGFGLLGFGGPIRDTADFFRDLLP